MKDNQLIRLDIAFLPSRAASQATTRLSRQLSNKYKAYYILDEKNFFPHVTIYFPLFPIKNLSKILQRVRAVADDFTPFKSRFTHFKSTDSDGSLIISFEKNKTFYQLHQTVVKVLNSLREGSLREKYLNKMDQYSRAQQENIKRYGSPNILSLYTPHITITQLKNPKTADKLAETLKWPLKEVLIEQIGVFTMGEHGTCTKLLKSWTLNKVEPGRRCDLGHRF